MNSTRQASSTEARTALAGLVTLSLFHGLLRRTRVWAVAGGLLLCCGLAASGAPPPGPATINFAWNASPSGPTNVSGYNLWWGPAPATYTNFVFIPGGSTTTGAVSNLTLGSTYYFNITATNSTTRQESIYDGEVFTTLPVPPAPATNLRIRLGP